MEKRISFFEFQSVKSVAKAIEPKKREQQKIMSQIEKLADAYKKCQADIEAYEAGIVNVIGFHVDTLVQKSIETRAGKNGEEVKVTKYVPTDYVTYDDATKEYVINVPDELEKAPVETTSTEEKDVVEMPEAGNDFDVDGEVPFDAPNKTEEEIF